MSAEAYPFELDVCAKCEHTFRRPTPAMIGGLAIKPSLRVVWRVELGGTTRSFLSRKGAYGRYARKKMAEHYPCDGHYDEEGQPAWGRAAADCGMAHFDGDDTAKERVFARFVRWLMWHDRHVRKHGTAP